MDVSDLSPAVILLVSLVAFVYLSATEGLYRSENSAVHNTNSIFSSSILWLLITGTVLAVVLCSVNLLLNFTRGEWTPVSLLSLIILVILWITHNTILKITIRSNRNRFPLLSTLLRFLDKTTIGVTHVNNPITENIEGASEVDAQPDAPIPTKIKDELVERERGMIRSIRKLDEVTAREIMVPRMDIIAVDLPSDLSEVATLMVEQGHSKLPVYKETLDEIVGVIHARDLLEVLSKGKSHVPIEGLVRTILFTPESKPVDQLLYELQKKRLQLALVIDEYGGTEGLISMEDVLEEIVGEIEDEFSRSEPRLVVLSDVETMIDARINLDYVNESLGTNLNKQNVDTIGGLVYSILGRIPRTGDEVTIDGLKITVVSTRGRRIRQLRVIHPDHMKEHS